VRRSRPLWKTASITSSAVKSRLEGQSRTPLYHFLPDFGLVSVVAPPSASTSMPSHAPASLANGSPGHTDAPNPCPARSASIGDLGDAVRLLNRGERHSLRRCCEGQDKANCNQPDHSFLLHQCARGPTNTPTASRALLSQGSMSLNLQHR